MDKYIGTMLSGRYEILEILGVGGMAVVYRAKCHVLNRYVAIKILKEEFAQDEEFRRRFYNESQAVAKLSHHNIVSVYDVCCSDGVDYIVMELIEGITLKEFLQKRGKLTWQQTLFFAEQIAKALEHAHSRGIIHQDIKPQNIIILRDGTAKVTDFGIARLEGNQETRVIQEAIGSVHYISPEQAKGSTIDSRTDVYSLGVVMYEMLTGKLPFEGETALSIVMQHINAMPLMPSEIVDGVPKGMDDIVMRAMCPNVSKRYLSAEALYADLESLKRDAGTEFGYTEHDVRGDAPSFDETQAIPPIRETAAASSHAARRIADEDEEPADAAEYDRTSRRTAPQRKRKKSFWQKVGESPAAMAGIAVAVFAVIAVCVGVYLLNSGGSTQKVTVPDFTNAMYEEVVKQYTDFTFERAPETVQDDSLAEGTVVHQSISQGDKVSRGTKIVLTVVAEEDDPREAVTIPDNFMDGKVKSSTATKWLNDREIEYRIEEEDDLTVEKDMVIRTDPAVGESVVPGKDTVIVYVSTGVSGVKRSMPTLVGLTQEQAEQRLTEFNLDKDVILEENAAVKGQVFYQSIQPGTEVDEGAKVTIRVSMGLPDTVVDPPSGEGEGDVQPPDSDSEPDAPTPGDTQKTVKRDIALPKDRESVHVRVTLDDGTVAFDDTVDTSQEMLTVSLTGSGTRLMTVYFDGEKAAQEEVPIS